MIPLVLMRWAENACALYICGRSRKLFFFPAFYRYFRHVFLFFSCLSFDNHPDPTCVYFCRLMLRSEDMQLDVIDGWGHGYLVYITYLSTYFPVVFVDLL